MSVRVETATTKVEKGATTVVEWLIQGWNGADPDASKIIQSTASCIVTIGEEQPMISPQSKTKLRFYLQEYKNYEDPELMYCHQTQQYVHCSQQQSNSDGLPSPVPGQRVNAKSNGYSLVVDVLNLAGSSKKKSVSLAVKCTVTRERSGMVTLSQGSKNVDVITPFCRTCLWTEDLERNKGNVVVFTGDPVDLKVKLIVTEYLVKSEGNGEEGMEEEDKSHVKWGAMGLSENTIGGNLGKMYNSQDNFSDLMVQSNDQKILTVHKVVLAARSPYFYRVLQMSENGARKSLVFGEADGQTLLSIVHWMYTDELHQDSVDCIPFIARCAAKFQFVGLLELLNEKMVDFCKQENMFSLFEVAREYKMKKAFVDVSTFIAKNFDVEMPKTSSSPFS